MKKYSELRKSERPSIERLLPLRFPISVYIEPTNQCNFRCCYCPMSLIEYPKIVDGFKTMKLSQFKKICSNIQEGGKLKVLRFYLVGEPLLNPNLPEMIKLSCDMKLSERTELTTNGVLLNEDISTKIIKSGLDYLRISISSVNQQKHEHITHSNVSIRKIYNNVKQFKQIRDRMGSKHPFLYIKMIDSQHLHENTSFMSLYKDIGDEVSVENPMNWNGYDNHTFIENHENSNFYQYPKLVCPFPFYTVAINVNGDVTTCCVDWNKETKIGNVFESSLQSIWNGEKARSFRHMHASKKREENLSCSQCKFLFTTPDNIDNVKLIQQ